MLTEGVLQSLRDYVDREVGDVNSDPAASEPLRRVDGGATSAKRVQHNVTRVAARFDNSLK